jgi:hypothetical protein
MLFQLLCLLGRGLANLRGRRLGWVAVILAGSAAALLTGGAVQAQTATEIPLPPFRYCPPVGESPSCKVLLVVEPSGSVTVYSDDAVGDYDGGDDTLVGIWNNSSSSVDAVTVAGPGSSLAGFDGDGLCTYISCTWPAPTGYEGPQNTFTTDPTNLDSAEVDFSGGWRLALQPISAWRVR